MLNKVEVEILQHMLENKLINEINSRTIRNISKGIEINYFRTRNYVNHLKLLGLLDSGFKELNSGTFYITKKGLKLSMRKPEIGLKVKPGSTNNYEKIIPTQCPNPKCRSSNIIGRGMVMGMAYINLETMNVDELGDDFEVCDKDNLRYRCFNCEWDWE